jgi:hypothetical protein
LIGFIPLEGRFFICGQPDFHHRRTVQYGTNFLGDRKLLNVPTIISQFRDPGWQAPLHIQNFLGMEDQIIDRFKTGVS